MFSEDEFLPLSGLQHFAFCPRQWALIHLEQVWAENRLTAEGRERHDVVHEEGRERRNGVRIVRSLSVHSFELGMAGICDVVEFPEGMLEIREPDPDLDWLEESSPFPARPGVDSGSAPRYPVPVEYKRGKPKVGECDRIQLCAQAICLEEMTGAMIPAAALYYWETRRREPVDLTIELRARTRTLAAEMHRLYRARVTPRAAEFKGCRNCSLKDLCLPRQTGGKSAKRYFVTALLRRVREGSG